MRIMHEASLGLADCSQGDANEAATTELEEEGIWKSCFMCFHICFIVCHTNFLRCWFEYHIVTI